jgi:DnaJ-class molecular chaperone
MGSSGVCVSNQEFDMNGHCETCHSEKVCAYPYKPTECANLRKFEMHPDAIDCPTCGGSGYTYPWQCKNCKGTGLVLAVPAHQ